MVESANGPMNVGPTSDPGVVARKTTGTFAIDEPAAFMTRAVRLCVVAGVTYTLSPNTAVNCVGNNGSKVTVAVKVTFWPAPVAVRVRVPLVAGSVHSVMASPETF